MGRGDIEEGWMAFVRDPGEYRRAESLVGGGRAIAVSWVSSASAGIEV